MVSLKTIAQNQVNFIFILKHYTGFDLKVQSINQSRIEITPSSPQIFSGENLVKVRVGQANIQSAYLSIHLAYRTELVFAPSKRNMHHDQMMLKSDHFKAESSPRNQRNITERYVCTYVRV